MCFSHLQERLTLFSPQIVRCVRGNELVSYLEGVISERSQQKIRRLSRNESDIDSMEHLLNCLKCSKHPKKLQKFVDALEECGYQYIAAALKGSEFPKDVFAKKKVLTAHKKIFERLDPKEVVPELNRRKVINDIDTANILATENNDGPIDATDILLDRVWRRHGNWFAEFLDVLSEYYSHICKKVDPGIFTNRNCVNQVDPVVNTEDELRTAFKSIEAQAQKLLELNPSASREDSTFHCDYHFVDSVMNFTSTVSKFGIAYMTIEECWISSPCEEDLILIAWPEIPLKQPSSLSGLRFLLMKLRQNDSHLSIYGYFPFSSYHERKLGRDLSLVAYAVANKHHILFESVNDMFHGHNTAERIISSAKEVAVSVDDLVATTSVKAQTNSFALKRLVASRDAVRCALEALVKAATATIDLLPAER